MQEYRKFGRGKHHPSLRCTGYDGARQGHKQLEWAPEDHLQYKHCRDICDNRWNRVCHRQWEEQTKDIQPKIWCGATQSGVHLEGISKAKEGKGWKDSSRSLFQALHQGSAAILLRT